MSSRIDERFQNSNLEDVEQPKLQQKLQVERKRYMKHKFMHDILTNIIEEDLLDKKLSEKVKDTLIYQDVLESTSLDASDMFSVLGLSVNDLIPPELTYQEQCKLKSSFEHYVSNYYRNFQTMHVDLIQANLCTNMYDKLITDLKEHLSMKQQADIQNLTEVSANLEHIIKLRTEELPKIVARKIEEYELKMKITYAKYRVLLYRLKKLVFTEVDKSFEAYQELIRDVQEQMEACRKNIQTFALQKEKYAVVHCKEFDSILEEYLQYKTLIHDKRTLLEKLQK